MYGVGVKEVVDALWVGDAGVCRCVEKQGLSMWMKKKCGVWQGWYGECYRARLTTR